ncbi:MAG: hypothetical protein NZ923_02175 [Candidatus Kryptonium sp.]|nr:hypothetical protein [Candidatus Kryptonium sp.]
MRKNIYYAIFLFLLIVVSIFPNGAFSQDYTDILPHKSEKTSEEDEHAKSSVYLEILGQGLYLSANYDYRFKPNLTARIGIGTALLAFSFPATINYLTFPESSHHLEIGGGFIIARGGFDNDESIILPTANIGYRFQPKKGGLFFRIAWTPLLSFLIHEEEKDDILERLIWGGISIGYTFR